MTQILALPLLTIAAVTSSNEDWLDSLLFTQPDGITPVDLTGISFMGQLRLTAGSREVALAFSTDSASLSNGGATGILSFNVQQASMANIAGSYVLDIIASGDGNQRQAVNGTVQVTQGVTR